MSTFLQSAVQSAGEVFGIDPSLDVELYRAQNPIKGFASQVIGFGGPSGAYYAATRRLGGIGRGLDDLSGRRISQMTDRMLDSSSLVQRGGFVGGAAEEIYRFAPFEVATLGIGTINRMDEDTTFGEALTTSALQSAQNLAIGGAIGGGFSKLFGPKVGSSGDADFASAIEAIGSSMDKPRTQQLADLYAAKDAAERTGQYDRGLFDTIQASINRLSNEVRIEKAGTSYWEGASNISKEYFEGAKGVRASQLNYGRDGLPSLSKNSTTTWESVRDSFGLREDFERFSQFPRVLTGDGGRIQQLYDGLENVIDNNGVKWRYRQEAAKDGTKGAFVVMGVKDIDGKKVGLTLRGTDLGGLLGEAGERAAKISGGPAQARLYANTLLDPAYASQMQADARYFQLFRKEAEVFDTNAATSLDDAVDAELRSRLGAAYEAIEPKELRRLRRETGARLANELAPSQTAFTDNALARNTLQLSIRMLNAARNRAQDLVYGTATTGDSTALGAVLRGGVAKGGIDQAIKSVGDLSKATGREAWAQVLRELRGVTNDGDKVSEGVASTVREITGLVRESYDDLVKHQQAADSGFDGYGLTDRQLMDTVTRVGKHRSEVVNNKTGETVGVLYGTSEANILRQFEKLREREGSKFGLRGRDGKQIFLIRDNMDDVRLTKKIGYASPAREEYQAAISRVKSEQRDADGRLIPDMSPTAFLDRIYEHVRAHQFEAAKNTFSYELSPQFQKLLAESPNDLINVSRRIGREVGEQGFVSKAFVKTVDKAIGKGNTERVLGALNEYTYAIQLGFFNLSHAALTIATPLQTVAPEIYFLTKAKPERVAQYYSSLPAFGSDQIAKGSIGTLDPYRIMFKALGEMQNPTGDFKEFLRQAVSERFLDPKITDEFLGRDSSFARSSGRLMKEGRYWEFIKELGTVLPRKSEEISRLHAISTGYIVGRDLLNLSGNRLKVFTEEFTNQTMYQYNVGDRPNLLTGTIGSTWGLYKNFMFNYMAQMGKYAGTVKGGDTLSPVLAMAGGTGALGGFGALGPTYFLADQASKLLTDQGLTETYYGQMRDWGVGQGTSDFLFWGAPSALNLSLQSQVQQPGRDPMDDAGFLLGFAQLNMFRYLYKAAGTTVDAMAGGRQPYEDPLIGEQLARALTPKVVWRSIQTAHDDSIRSLNSGYPLVSDFKETHRELAYALGFTDLEAAKTFEVANKLWKDKENNRKAVAAFGRRYADASLAGDQAEMTKVLKLAAASGVAVDSVMRSANSRLSKAEQDATTRGQDAEASLAYRLLLGLEQPL